MKSFVFLLVAFCLVGVPASAKNCGDDVDGVDVPCSCGDIVVSDLVLSDDPVTEGPCEGTGLIVRAAGPERITVDLAGKTLLGSGSGQGITVVFGGDRGAQIVSSGGKASIEKFANGVVASGGGLNLLENVVVRDSVRDGIRVRSTRTTVRGCEAVRSGRDGFAFSGRGYLSEDNESRANKRHGFMLMGQGGDLRECRAIENEGSGWMVTGIGHEISKCVASVSGKNGIEVVASKLAIRDCLAESNGASGIDGHGAGWRLSGNLARGNAEHGLDARGAGMVDEGGNRGVGNGFSLKEEIHQCRIGGVACAVAVEP